MTTIAFSRGVLASDSLCTANGTRGGFVTKIGRNGRVLYGAAGVASLCRKFLEWMDGGMEGPVPKVQHETDDDLYMTCAIFPEGDTVVQLDLGGVHEMHSEFFAMGSGKELALGAMRAGATPEEAVAAAIKFDVGSGGPVQCVRRPAEYQPLYTGFNYPRE